MKDYLYAIIDTYNDKLFVLDADGKFINFIQPNEPADLIAPESEFIGKHFSEVLPPNLSDLLTSAINEVNEKNEFTSVEYSLQFESTTKWYKAIISKIYPKNKTTYLISVRDITEFKKNELFIKGILDSSPIGIVSVTSVRNKNNEIIDFTITSANQFTADFAQRPLEELIGASVLENTQGVKTLGLFDKLVYVVESGEKLDTEINYKKRIDSTFVWVKITASKFDDGLIITFEDINKKKSLEIEAENRINIQSMLRKLATSFINVSDTDIDEVINQSIAEIGEFIKVDRVYIFDYLFDKKLIRNTHEWCAPGISPEIENLQFVPLELIPNWVDAHKQFKMFTVNDVYKLEEGSYLQDLLLSQNIKSLTTIPLVTGKEVLGFVGFDSVKNFREWNDDELALLKLFADLLVNVKLKIKYEKILKENQEMFKNLAENMLDMVALLEPDGTFLYVSPSSKSLLGYSHEEMVGKNFFEFIHPDDIKRIREDAFYKAIDGNKVENVEYRFRRKTGDYIWFETNSNPIANDLGEVLRLQTISRDVTRRIETDTEIRNLNKELQELNVQKNKLFSIIAHDLRSPIASSQSILQLLEVEHEDVSKEELKEYINELKISTSNTLELLEDLLLWSSSQLDKVTFKPEPIELNSLVDEVIGNLTTPASVKSISIVNKTYNGLKIETDKSMLKTVIRNLISNAIKYSYTNGVVTVEGEGNNGDIKISVSDKGIGIKDEDKGKIFNKSVNFTTYGTNNEKGSGIGLDLCSDFVRRMGGKINFESEYGKGTTFLVSFNSHV